MVIYDNGFLKLDYETNTDILSVMMPPVDTILLPEVARSFGVIVEHVRNYDIKKLLIDARETRVDVEEEVFKPIISDFVKGLASTRIKRVARLVSPSFARELVVTKVFQDREIPIEFESFTEATPAYAWLEND
ncbi:hypothetical protein TH63_07195 [Rufibacter radiotolerans]|uniref:STAS/SEC14 domain-containing protein n=1 Tax=Rufibacter radiotolerans TaxID=1379910 RepID=A0A0H4W4X0_9BACT|nr:hypothetical protein [Rufibacter radiotolerans]AKQ45476.1 hypothetical protein TH63_07195 [Rufibacter radiotolerans]